MSIDVRSIIRTEPVRVGIGVLVAVYIAVTLALGEAETAERIIHTLVGTVVGLGGGEAIRSHTRPYNPPEVEEEARIRVEAGVAEDEAADDAEATIEDV